jgi:hypothetical protein
MTAPLSRAEILALPPTHGLPTLGKILGVSEPVIRERARLGELDKLGIKVVKLGAQYRVVTASVWAFLGLDPAADGASTEAQPRRAARPGRPTASALRSVSGGDEAG